MDQNVILAFHQRLTDTQAERDRVRSLVRAGRWKEAELDVARFKGFVQRRAAGGAAGGAEAIQGDTLDFQPVSFLVEGAAARRAVAFVEATCGTQNTLGTGFMISPRLFLTNQHVIRDGDAARGSLVTFDREIDEQGWPRPTTSFTLDPGSFALFSPEEELDYALVAIGARVSGDKTIADFGCCPLSDSPNKHVVGMNANIIQHPEGARKVISIRNNLLVARTDNTLLYETDTEPGSSGSPVFNDDWEVVALHHYGEPYRERLDDPGNPAPTNVNEGIRASALYGDLQKKLDLLPRAQQLLLKEALDLGQQAAARTSGTTLGPPQPAAKSENDLTPSSKEAIVSANKSPNVLEIVVPLRISIALDGAAAASTPAPTIGEVARPSLGRSAEAIHVDGDYSNRKGFDPNFIPGRETPLPTLVGETAKLLAPLQANEPNAAVGELRYEHFSIKMNRVRRMAIFTATNLDGQTYLEVDRKSGEAVDGAEGETWARDPRISANCFLDQTFYSDWSQYFDRGHLTRRTDPTWGDKEEAERANADTFHFTNCTPQHFRFNQSAKYWQGVERYVLENGVLAQESKSRLCVFQGPIFDKSVDRMAGDVQIPSSFFKVVVWNGANGLKAVALVVDQGPLLDEQRKNLGQPHDLKSVDVNHWRVAVSDVEQRTGLDFGKAIRDADTIGQAAQPAVGAEARLGRLITKMEDIVL